MEQLACPDAKRFLEIARGAMAAPSKESISRAFVTRHRLLRTWAEFFGSHDLVLAPIATMPAFPLGADLDSAGAGAFLAAMRMTIAVSFLGLPSAAAPVPGDGLPQAVQLIAPRYREDLCLDGAEAIERQLGAPTPVDPR
jgi:amidase